MWRREQLRKEQLGSCLLTRRVLVSPGRHSPPEHLPRAVGVRSASTQGRDSPLLPYRHFGGQAPSS